MGREMYERNRVGFVALWTDDLPAERDALMAALGLTVRFEDDSLVVFAMEGTDLVLRRADGEMSHLAGQVTFGFYREDLDAATADMREAHADILQDRHPIGAGQRATTLRLPGGHTLDIVGR